MRKMPFGLSCVSLNLKACKGEALDLLFVLDMFHLCIDQDVAWGHSLCLPWKDLVLTGEVRTFHMHALTQV